MLKQIFPLATRRLVLRPLEAGDFAQFEKKMLEAARENPAHIPTNIETDFTDRLRQVVAFDQKFSIAAFDCRRTDRLVADLTFRPVDRTAKSLSVTYYTMQRYRRLLMMTEILQRVLPVLHDEYGVSAVHAVIEPDNRNSLKTAARLGFRPEGRNVYVYKC